MTLAVTATHRREHTEVARVLRVLGAGPDSTRRLSAYTAGMARVIPVAREPGPSTGQPS